MSVANCIFEIQRIIADAWLHSSATLTYHDPKVRADLKTVRERYPEFVKASEDAHLGQAVVLLYSLLETRGDTANFRQLSRLLEEEEDLIANQIPDLKENLDRAKGLWIKVSILRNDVIGHRAREHTREESFSKANLTPNNLMDLTELFKNAINAVTRVRDNTSWIPLMDTGPDLKKILAKLAAERST